VEPIPNLEESDLRSELAAELQHFGVSRGTSQSLATDIIDCGLLPDPARYPGLDRELAEDVARRAASVLGRWSDDPDVAWLKLAEMAYHGWGIDTPEDWGVDEAESIKFLRRVAQERHIRDFGPALGRLGTGTDACNYEFVHLLREQGLFGPDAVLEAAALRGRTSSKFTYRGSDGAPGDLDRDFRRLEYWLYNDTVLGLKWFIRALRMEPDDTVASLVPGFEQAVYSWFMYEELDETEETGDRDAARERWGSLYGQAWTELARELLPVVDELERRAENLPDDVDLTRAWLYSVWRVFEHMPERMSEERRRKVLEAAKEKLGRVRPLLASGDAENARAAFRDRVQLLGDASLCLMLFDSLWSSLKPLLLAFRQLPEPAVGPDLRYWPEAHNDPCPPPHPWRELPSMIAARLHYGLRMAQPGDPELRGVRSEFGRFLLDRLRTRRDARPAKGAPVRNEDMVDPSPLWRLGYVRALRALLINPDGKGHRTLNWSKKLDPDDRVREEAASAYKELRHGPSVPESMSPRRPLFAALLWLRRAHLEALGCRIDEAGAQRTFRKEVRRTEERDAGKSGEPNRPSGGGGQVPRSRDAAADEGKPDQRSQEG
jgi:hypothetical protein